MESTIRRARGRSHTSDSVRDDIYRSELSDGNVGSWPIRLFALLLFQEIAREDCTRQRRIACVPPSRSILHRRLGRGPNDKEHSRACQTRRASRSIGTRPYRDGAWRPHFAAALRYAEVREQSPTRSRGVAKASCRGGAASKSRGKYLCQRIGKRVLAFGKSLRPPF